MAHTEHLLEIVEIIGWHDGITEALARSADGRWMYVSMLAWTQEETLRIFGLMEMDDVTMADLRALSAAFGPGNPVSTDLWPALRSRVNAFLEQVGGRAELRLCEEIDGEPKATVNVEAGEIAQFAGQDADETLNGTRFAELKEKFFRANRE